MDNVRIETVDRRTETRVGSASVVRDISLDDQLWGHVLRIPGPVTRYLLVESTTDLFAVDFSLKTSGDITHVVDYARELAHRSKQGYQTDEITAEPQRQSYPTSAQLLSDVAQRRRRSVLWNGYLIAGLAVLEFILYFQLKGLESGQVESVRVWAPVAAMYKLAGFWGAMSVLPALGVLALLGQSIPFPFKLQKVLVVLTLGMTCLAFWGLAIWIVFLPVSDGEGFRPIFLAFAALPALLGSGFGFLAWHNLRLPLEGTSAPKPSAIHSLVEQDKRVKAAVVIAIVAIIGGVLALMVYYSLH